MNTLYVATAVVSLYVNDNDALIPEVWANMGLAILEENMVAAQLVHRDFSDEVANFGDVVNTRRPGQFNIRRKGDNDTVLGQDAIVTNVRVPLDQHLYTNFTIKDGEMSKSFQDLVDTHLRPAMQNVARGVDRAILGRVHGYLANAVGGLDALTGSTSRDTILDARQKMNDNRALAGPWNMVVSSASETALLKTDLFTKANERGDGGNALEEAMLGRLLGFNFFMDQNVPATRVVDSDVTAGVTAGIDAAGTLLIDITLVGENAVGGEWVTIAGENQPHYVTAYVNTGGDIDSLTIDGGLTVGTASGAVVNYYNPCAIENVGGYAAGSNLPLNVDGFATGKPPMVGQLVALGVGASRRVYTIIESEVVSATDQSILLDRPLELAVIDAQAVFPGPAGSYNLGFHREALALVNRPLALPASNLGVSSSVASYNDISMRVSMQYNIAQQGTVVTCDLLCGVQILDTNLGVVMLG
jgi:hypothetical protein